MTHTPVTSSTIATVAHDPATQTLEVRFKPSKKDAALGKGPGAGPLWRYEGVPAETHAALLAAESPGAYFAAEIKNVFQATRVA